jgi:hypothetical protein
MGFNNITVNDNIRIHSFLPKTTKLFLPCPWYVNGWDGLKLFFVQVFPVAGSDEVLAIDCGHSI